MSDDSRIPVTILTGFLGAGKTSVLNALIRNYKGKRIAVIENEFGEISIDSDLIVNTDGEVFELKNGCVCCSLNGELMETLNMLLQREERMDYLIIETTGIADPGPVAFNFLQEMEVQEMFRLDAVITVADSSLIEQQIENEAVAGKQLAVADMVLLNKSSEADPYLLEVATNTVKRINPQAVVLLADYGQVKGHELLDLKAFDPETILKQSWQSGKSLTYSPVPKSAHPALVSHSFEFPEPLDMIRFGSWITGLLYFNSAMVYRIKGILNVADSENRMIFQSVYRNYLSQSGGTWQEGETRATRLVFIGRQLDRDSLEKGLKQCIMPEE